MQDQQGNFPPKCGLEFNNSYLQWILHSFRDVFKELYGLPPQKSHDHKITLKQGSEPVCVRTYRYPHFQKKIRLKDLTGFGYENLK